MSLRSLMKATLERRLSSDDSGDDATFLPKGHDTGFPLRVAIGDPTQTFIASSAAVENRRRVMGTLLQSVVEAGTEEVTGHARGPLNGDRLVITEGAYAGTWRVDYATPDSGGGLQVELVAERTLAAAHDGARKVNT